MNIAHTSISYPPPYLGIKNPYLGGLRYGFQILFCSTKHLVRVWNRQTSYLIPETREPNDP
uniref:Uncharacterized protein n=1 Tax=Daucus carota subsp. sativus TaxID=79200 RepID=A0A164SNX2_DAUCS